MMKNMHAKKKVMMVGPSNEEEKKSKRWDDSAVEVLLDCALEQVNMGEHTGGGLTKHGWRDAKAKFRSKTCLKYDDLQIKNKWDAMKKKWQIWYRIFGKETGLGWNYEKNNFEASADWWEKKIMEDPEASQFRKNGLKFVDKLTFLFAPGTSTGEHCWAPSSGVLPEEYDNLDTTEGSGDSEDLDVGGGVRGASEGTSVGGSMGFGKFTLNNSAGSSLSGKKRKHDGSLLPKGGKPTQRKKLNTYIERLLGACESRTTTNDNASNAKLSDPCTISSVMKEIKKLPGMEAGSGMLGQCCLIMKDPTAREMFVALEDADARLDYLTAEIHKANKL